MKRMAAYPSSAPTSQRAFTLVEILIVVVILGILAAIAVPKLTNASELARENALKQDLRLLRTQINVYRADHHDVPPGYPNGDLGESPTATAFNDQLTLYTNVAGSTSTTGDAAFKFGPYITRLPPNSVSGLATVKILGPDDQWTADDTTGWLYQPSTGELRPNIQGVDSDSHPYMNY